MRDAAGDHREADDLRPQRRVLLDEQVFPLRPQVWASRRGSIGQGFVGAHAGEVFHHRIQVHRLAVLLGDSDCGVVASGLLFGLGRLGENSLGEEQFSAQFREHREHVGVISTDSLIEFNR